MDLVRPVEPGLILDHGADHRRPMGVDGYDVILTARGDDDEIGAIRRGRNHEHLQRASGHRLLRGVCLGGKARPLAVGCNGVFRPEKRLDGVAVEHDQPGDGQHEEERQDQQARVEVPAPDGAIEA